MKRVIAAIITVGLMALLVGSALRRGNVSGRTEADSTRSDDLSSGDPSVVVEAMIEAGRRGDVPGYLDAFSGPMRDRIDQESRDRGRSAFADDLGKLGESRKGFAIFGVEADGPGASKVVVESIFGDRIERQTYQLGLIEGRWRIVGVETLRRQQPKARFGTPADFQEPEGIPVPATVRPGSDDDVGARP